MAGLLLVLALAAAGPATPAAGPVLVLVAHPDDEGLGMAGIIASSRAAGRPVYVAVVTNGDALDGGSARGYCGAAAGTSGGQARLGLTRDKETVAAMALLDVAWSPSMAASHVFFLGYPDGAVTTIAQASTPWSGDRTGLHGTYAEDGDGLSATCNGDFRFLVSGHHSQLSASALAADVDALVTRVKPTDLYTHAEIDSHGDHAEVYRQVVASLRRTRLVTRLHSTLIHPEQGNCHQEWPNPSLPSVGGNVFARFTPTIDFTAPRKPACARSATLSWGSWGPPNEWVDVPASMQATSEASNLKWQVLSKYASQLAWCPGNCDYFRAFVKRREFFWTSSTAFQRLGIGRGPVRVSASGKGRIWVNCPKGGPDCIGRLTMYQTAVLRSRAALPLKRRILGSGTFRLRAGSARRVALKLNSHGLRRLRQRGSIGVHVVVAPADGRPAVSRSIRLVLVRAARR